MASSVSTLNNYSDTQVFDFGDLELLTLGLGGLQGQVDVNKNILRDIDNNLSGKILNNLSREVDREYFQEKLDNMLYQVENKLQTADLLDLVTIQELSKEMTSLVKDGRIINGVAATVTRREENEEWNYYKTNNPYKYSDKNRAVMSKSWERYLNNQDPNAVYNGGGGFVEYVDYDSLLLSEDSQKAIKNLGINGKWVVRQDGGRFFEFANTYEGTRPENLARLKQAVSSIIGEKGLTQMKIDAEYNFSDYNNPSILNSVKENYNNHWNTLTDKLSYEKDKIEKFLPTATPKEKEIYQQQLEQLNNQLDIISNRDFDKDVTTNGQFDENKYRSAYTSLYTDSEIERLTSLQYQPPALVETKTEDYKFKIAKFNHEVWKEQKSLDLREQQLNLNKINTEIALQKSGLNSDGTPAKLEGLNESTARLIDEVDQGSINLESFQTGVQGSTIKAIENSTGMKMNRGDRFKLIDQILSAGGDVTKIKTISIGGNDVTINDNNRGQILASLSKFKEVFIDGDSSYRNIKNTASSVLNDVEKELITHAVNNTSEQKNLNVHMYSSYIDVDKNGQYVTKQGKFAGAGNKSNYQYLVDKIKTKGETSLTKAEKATLKMLTAQSLIDSKNDMTEFEKQSVFTAMQEDVYNMLGKSGKVVNTMGTYTTFRNKINNNNKPSNNRTEITTGDGFGDSGYFSNEMSDDVLRYSTTAGRGFSQDTDIRGLGWTDGASNLKKTLTTGIQTLKTVVNQTNRDIDALETRYFTADSKSDAGKQIQTKLGVKIPDNAIITIKPEIVNGKETDNLKISYSEIVKKGESAKETPLSGTLKFEDLGGYYAPTPRTVYDSGLGTRAGNINLGTSPVVSTTQDLVDITKDKPSTAFNNTIKQLKSQYKNPTSVNFINDAYRKYNSGAFSFEVSNLGEKGGTYKIVMADNESSTQTVISDLGVKILSDNIVSDFYQRVNNIKETEFINSYLLPVLNNIE